MSRSAIDIWVGLFVAIGIASVLFLATQVGNLNMSGVGETYRLVARFDNIGGLKVRAPIKSAGVIVGRVAGIRFDTDTYLAHVDLDIDVRYRFPADTFGSILTSGLLGEQYVGLEAGGDDALLEPGSTLKKTQSAVVLEKLISQFMFNQAQQTPDASGKP